MPCVYVVWTAEKPRALVMPADVVECWTLNVRKHTNNRNIDEQANCDNTKKKNQTQNLFRIQNMKFSFVKCVVHLINDERTNVGSQPDRKNAEKNYIFLQLT